MQRKRLLSKTTPPVWWLRCAIIALACLQVVAPTWHICSMGATGPAPQQMSMQHCGMPSMQQSGKAETAALANLPMQESCLAQLLRHMLGNNQFHLVLDFSAVTIATLPEPPSATPLLRTIPVDCARGPPRLLIG